MKTNLMLSRAILGSIALFALSPAPAMAQLCADKFIKIVVPYAPGTTDQQARALARGMSKILDKPIIIENRAGAGGSLGTAIVANSNPDGCTLLYASAAPLTIVPLVSTVSYAYDQLVPVAKVMASPHLLVAGTGAPYKNLDELIAYARQNPGKINFGSAGTGSSVHLAGMAFAKQAGIEITHIPFQGGAPALVAALGGHVDMLIGLPITLLPQVQAGKLVAIAQLGSPRSPALPDVPTTTEKGVELNLIANHGIFVAKGTPDAIRESLQSAVKQTMLSQDFMQFVAQNHEAPKFDTGAEFQKDLDAEKLLMAELIKELSSKERQ